MMIFAPQYKALKNGQTVEIRQACAEDAVELLRVVKEYAEETLFIPYAEGEFNPTVEEMRKWINTFSSSKNSLLLVATFQGRIIGNIDVSSSQRSMFNHTAVVGVGALAAWRGIGLGKALFQAAMDCIKQNTTIEILWLQVMSSNEIAMKLYANLGFEIAGRIKNFVKLLNGDYVDDIRMSLNIKQIK